MATREEKRERGGNEGKDCRRGRGNLKVRGRKEKVVEDKGERKGRWGKRMDGKEKERKQWEKGREGGSI